MSQSYFQNFSNNLNEILQQNLISNATYWKNWERANRSLTIGVSRDQNLFTGETREGLPSISFSQGTIFPFRKSTKTRGLSSESESELGFIDMLGFSYSANFSNARQKQLYPLGDSVKTSPTDSTLTRVKVFQRTNTKTLSQGVNFSISPKLGYFTVSPSLSLSDDRTWMQQETPTRNIDSTLGDSSSYHQTIRGFLNSGISTSTRFYGIFQPNVFGVSAIRHTVTPTFGISYNKQIYGDNMQKYSMIGSVNVGNNFEMKYLKNDSLKTEDKIQLLNIGAGLSYNFVADSMNFSEVGVNYRTDIGRFLGISGNASYNLYAFDPAVHARVNRFLLEEKGKFGDLTSFSLSLSTSFRGEKKQKPSEMGVPENVRQEQERVSGQTGIMQTQRKTYYSIYDKEDADFSIPWNINISYNFSQQQPTPQYYSRSSTINASLSFNLTDKWQISTGATYDFVRKKHFIPSLDITRDLHCWQMSFSWYPMGIREGYRFEIKVKAPQLQDIKVTKQSNKQGIYR
jgi:hypothetical protein